MEEDLKRTPPLPVDLTRKLRIFTSRVQYVELKITGGTSVGVGRSCRHSLSAMKAKS